MFGGVLLLGLYGLLIGLGYMMALQARTQFGRLIIMGITSTIFLYVFINTGMVMGLLPVVGVPLPLLSYGGTALWTLLIGIGLMLSVDVHPNTNLHRPSQF